ncbi:fructose-specific PTS transporter subunit EIIC [Streptomyces neyagawaensis]|uniref:fructose-specific PTS transporter subunit EIIC n=1 Tax=Streptomyces neyagawaensis TaxID=42238 RepID=UPI0006E18FBA|nr:fructose-specific PTS transporter subunit EIIC [Streptomyces neyagawaensis]MCL6737987.1 fructose-specific PTS transporter subunit EIIC [Streptomyces neyagawaensis]MDE1688292.1 fructose-specific PTS transporter subunit EIIC [Streptomyces neyagawaensis]
MPHSANPTTNPANPTDSGDVRDRHFHTRLGRCLASGTPHLAVLTALAAGLIVLAYAIQGPHVVEWAKPALDNGDWTLPQTWAAMLYMTGNTTLMTLPVFIAGYVACQVADRSAVFPGLLGGIAVIITQSGVLGGLIAGVTAGAAVLALQRIPLPRALRRTTTVLIPLLATLVTALVTVVVVGSLLNVLTNLLYNEMARLEFQNTLLLGLLLGLTACSDLGGLFTKTFFIFGAQQLSGPDPTRFIPLDMTVMAAIVAAGMVPPLAMTLATLVRRRLFTESERRYGKISWLFGAAFLPEGAAPFALADPLRVIPASMAGGAVTGALVMQFGNTISYPKGGVFAADQIGEPLLFAAAVAAGVLTTTALTIGLKSLHRTAPAASTTRAATRTPNKAVAAGRA